MEMVLRSLLKNEREKVMVVVVARRRIASQGEAWVRWVGLEKKKMRSEREKDSERRGCIYIERGRIN